MKALPISLFIVFLYIGCLTNCSKPYQIEKCYWVYASFQDSDNPDSLIKQLYTVDYAFCGEVEDYTDTILCYKLWVKKSGSTQTIRYYSDSITSFSLLKEWKTLNYQCK